MLQQVWVAQRIFPTKVWYFMGSTIGACISTKRAMPSSMGVDVTNLTILHHLKIWGCISCWDYTFKEKQIVNSKVVYDKSSRKEVLNHWHNFCRRYL